MDETEKRSCEPFQIPTLVKEVGDCIQTLGKTQLCQYRSEYEDIIKQGRYKILSTIKKIKAQDCRKPSITSKQNMERDIFMSNIESEFEEIKIGHLRKEWVQQQKTMAKLQESLYKKCRLLSLHSSYCSSQGSALSAILAVLMESQELVESFVAEPDTYLISFIKIADGCLFSFVRTYAYDVPLEDCTDYRYVLALFTCIAHISGLANGRQFLIQTEECQTMLSELIYVLPHVKHTTANTLKTKLLKILHDVTEEEEGLNFVSRCSDIFTTLDNCIGREYDPEAHKYSLEILERITKEIPNKEFLNRITNSINMQRLTDLSGPRYREVNRIPRNIFQNIRIAADNFRFQDQAQGDTQLAVQSTCPCTSEVLPRKRSRSPTRRIQTKHTIRLPKDHTQAHIRVSQKFKPVIPQSSSSSSFSSSSLSRSTEYSQTETSTCSSPEGTKRPNSPSTRPALPLTLCASPCRRMFQLSSEGTRPGSRKGTRQKHSKSSCVCTSKPRSSGERPAFGPCTSGPYKVPSQRASFGTPPRPPSSGKSSKQNRTSAIPTKTMEEATKSRKTHSAPQTLCKPSCTATCKSKERMSTSLPPSRNPSKSKNEKTTCVCSSKSKSWESTSLPSSGKPSKSKSKLATYACSSKSRESTNKPTPSSSKRNSDQKTKQTTSDYQYKKPTYGTSRRRSWSPDLKRQRSPSKSKERRTSCSQNNSTTNSCLKQTSEEMSEVVTCVPFASSSAFEDANNTSPVCYDDTSSPSPSISDDEEDICTCGSYSEKMLVPWNAENRMIARLSEHDRRVGHRVKNTVRIVSRLENKTLKQHQRVVTRIKIPGLPFQRVMESRRH